MAQEKDEPRHPSLHDNSTVSVNVSASDEEDVEKYRHELDVMINEFRHSAYNTLINIRKNIKNKHSSVLQREKNICDNLVRAKEKERSEFEELNIRLKEQSDKATFMYNKMAD